MQCPSCGEDKNKVIDSRLTEVGSAIRRRRICLLCNRRFTTKERVEEELRLTVIKVGGERVPYDRDKILAGIERACYKLEVTEQEVQKLVDHVEEDLFHNYDREITTEVIGQYVGRYLRRLNAVVYVRFMSVHRKYTTVEEFIEEIRDVRVQAAHDDPGQQPLFRV